MILSIEDTGVVSSVVGVAVVVVVVVVGSGDVIAGSGDVIAFLIISSICNWRAITQYCMC